MLTARPASDRAGSGCEALNVATAAARSEPGSVEISSTQDSVSAVCTGVDGEQPLRVDEAVAGDDVIDQLAAPPLTCAWIACAIRVRGKGRDASYGATRRPAIALMQC
jgi:hypothetical protein